LALVVSSAGDAAAAPPAGAAHASNYYCSSEQNQRAMYFSAPFASSTPYSKVANAFQKALTATYGYNGGVACYASFPTIAAARTTRQSRITELRAAQKKVVETGWMFTEADAIAAAKAADSDDDDDETGPSKAPLVPGQDPRMAGMPARDRQLALNEVAASKRYCANSADLSALFDCSCFSRMVMDYRIRQSLEDKHARTGALSVPAPLSTIVTKVDPALCIANDRIMKWSAAQTKKTLTKRVAQNDKVDTDAVSSCVGKKMIRGFESEHQLGDIVKSRYEPAFAACVDDSSVAATAPGSSQSVSAGR
jgi:hypothetical protein